MKNNYTAIPALNSIVLEESWVRQIEASPGRLVFGVEFVVTPEHAAFVSPKVGELFSYRNGTLVFSGVRELSWLGQGGVPAHDANDELDYGHIDTFTWNIETYELYGDWGTLTVTASDVSVELTA